MPYKLEGDLIAVEKGKHQTSVNRSFYVEYEIRIIITASQISMRCYICGESGTSLTFPKDERLCFKWMSKLGLTEFPPYWARICSLHFSPCDFVCNGQRMALLGGALPLSKVS